MDARKSKYRSLYPLPHEKWGCLRNKCLVENVWGSCRRGGGERNVGIPKINSHLLERHKNNKCLLVYCIYVYFRLVVHIKKNKLNYNYIK